MSLVNKSIVWFLRNRISRIERFMNHPHEVQQEVFTRLVRFAEKTDWGRLYNYKSLRNYNDFAGRVPLQDYDQVKPYIEKMRRGENNLLWPTKTYWFAKSSGTTSDRSKFIPVTRESLAECHKKAGADVMTLYCHNRPGTKVFEGKGLVLGGSHKLSEFGKNARYGDLSAILLQNFPSWAKSFRTPALSLALLDNWEEKLDKIAHTTKNENVTSLSGVPSWNLILLKKILEITRRQHILEVWPNLELFNHGGVSFVPYREQFEKLIPSDQMYYLETYNASEGFFGAQDQAFSKDMLLMLDHGVFYEFIPLEDIDKAEPRVVTLEQVDTHTNYAMVISTNGGLWRYIIGDTIKFSSLAPYRIRLTGRTKNFINAFGEEVIVDNSDSALNKACKVTGAIIAEYTAAPVYLKEKEHAAHEYLIEFAVEPENLETFADVLDSELQNLNSDYEAKRSNDLMLKKPVVRSLPRDTFLRWLKSKGKMGGQNKVPRLYNERKYVEDILNFIKV
ncbi:MAG TPA: GH3 auxin-responsive promoter family protein [Bacteroidales bacterium]|nr:GH3 auxin-responsive promoter family protein [Bacteroidales bacterium]